MNFVGNSVLGLPQEGTKPVSDPARQTRILLENCLRQAEEVDYLTAKVAALTKLDAQGKELLAALDAQIVAQTRTIAALQAANKASSGIEVIDSKELKSFQASLDDAKKEIAKWKARAGFWKRIAMFGMVTMIGVGIAIGVVINK